jgi:hypothetical protein
MSTGATICLANPNLRPPNRLSRFESMHIDRPFLRLNIMRCTHSHKTEKVQLPPGGTFRSNSVRQLACADSSGARWPPPVLDLVVPDSVRIPLIAERPLRLRVQAIVLHLLGRLPAP